MLQQSGCSRGRGAWCAYVRAYGMTQLHVTAHVLFETLNRPSRPIPVCRSTVAWKPGLLKGSLQGPPVVSGDAIALLISCTNSTTRVVEFTCYGVSWT